VPRTDPPIPPSITPLPASSSSAPARSGPTLSRRTVLRTGAIAGAAAVVTVPGAAGAAASTPLFGHGVASGDPLPDAVMLWTRVTPTAASAPGSGTGPDTTVRWEVSRDRDFTSVVASGSVTATATSDHTVKVDVSGLTPATEYFYRFSAANTLSETGRTVTAPAPESAVSGLRLGVVSCANWEGGYFSAYRHLAGRDDLFAVVHLGDYLYEYGTGEYSAMPAGTGRVHEPRHEIVTLADYRIRHAQYKTDPDLRALHAAVPMIATWDDHESADNAHERGAENHDPATEGDWAARRAAATRAYIEWMPVRTDGSRLYRRFRFGTLAELSMLDLRTYRTEQPSLRAPRRSPADDHGTLTGARQMEWLTSGLTTSPTHWKLVGNPVMITPLLIPPLDPQRTGALTDLLGVPAAGVPVNTDQWDGYPADRQRLLDALRETGTGNVVFLTGDIHTTWASDVPEDAALYPAGSVATELVVPSVTSDNIDDLLGVPPRTATPPIEDAIRGLNRHIAYVELDSHGYGVLDVTPEAVQMDWFFLDDRTDPASGVTRAAGMRVRTGTAHVEPAPPL